MTLEQAERIKEILLGVWYREFSADEGFDLIEDELIAENEIQS
jgi:hypothetical protein